MGVLAHPTRAQTAPVAERIAESLRARGLEVWQYSQWDDDLVRPKIAGTDMVIAIGGDGAMLRAARVCAPDEVPLLGVNMGRLGFLTEIQQPDDWENSLELILDERCWIERRMMIDVTSFHNDVAIARSTALNDVVISRGAVTHTIQLDTYIDGYWTTSYNADALIIATATGSTAYALATGGPILPPELRNILVVPVAPHLSLDRPIVLPEGAMIEVVVTPDSQTDIIVAADGIQMCDVSSGDRVHVKASDHISQFVRLREKNYFYRSLLDRFEPRAPAPSAPAKKQL
jgi:NAD+ kinase